MSNMNLQIDPRRFFRSFRTLELLLMVALILLGTTSVFGWFVYDRHVDAIAKTSNPTAIFIGAGNEEDIMYMDLSDIDVNSVNSYDENEVTHYYKDFVFCIRGINVPTYRLQLAYTTNNQVNYTIYPAKEGNEVNVKGYLVYTPHTTGSSSVRYYIESSASPVGGTYLNKNTSTITGKNNDSYYTDTYDDYSNTYVHTYAVPIYWQSYNILFSEQDDGKDHSRENFYISDNNHNGEFCDYYFLRVSWTGEKTNDKETDIIYITAKNIAG